MDFNWVKTFCFVKDTNKKVKKQATDWEKIFENFASDICECTLSSNWNTTDIVT